MMEVVLVEKVLNLFPLQCYLEMERPGGKNWKKSGKGSIFSKTPFPFFSDGIIGNFGGNFFLKNPMKYFVF